MPHPAQELDLVTFEGHPRSAAEAQPTPGQGRPQVSGGDLYPGREALHDRHERRSV
jgi:hypothetical protein